MNKKINIGLFGYGCVGKGVYENIQKHFEDQIHVKQICIKHPEKDRGINQAVFTNEPSDLIEDPEIDLIVEAIDDAPAAIRIISDSFSAGRDVVSANKVAIATSLKFLIDLQSASGRTLLYEAAVVAAIPVLRLLETHYSNEPVNSVEGILNGTTNYLLSKMKIEKLSFKEALLQAQQEGFAESDPSLDIEGWDAAYKLVILSAHAFGHLHAPDEVVRNGLPDFLSSRTNDHSAFKCVGSAVNGSYGASLQVGFKRVESSSDFWPVEYQRNAVSINSSIGGINTLLGNGAGSDATASAIIADIFHWKKGFRYEYLKYFEKIRRASYKRKNLQA